MQASSSPGSQQRDLATLFRQCPSCDGFLVELSVNKGVCTKCHKYTGGRPKSNDADDGTHPPTTAQTSQPTVATASAEALFIMPDAKVYENNSTNRWAPMVRCFQCWALLENPPKGPDELAMCTSCRRTSATTRQRPRISSAPAQTAVLHTAPSQTPQYAGSAVPPPHATPRSFEPAGVYFNAKGELVAPTRPPAPQTASAPRFSQTHTAPLPSRAQPLPHRDSAAHVRMCMRYGCGTALPRHIVGMVCDRCLSSGYGSGLGAKNLSLLQPRGLENLPQPMAPATPPTKPKMTKAGCALAPHPGPASQPHPPLIPIASSSTQAGKQQIAKRPSVQSQRHVSAPSAPSIRPPAVPPIPRPETVPTTVNPADITVPLQPSWALQFTNTTRRASTSSTSASPPPPVKLPSLLEWPSSLQVPGVEPGTVTDEPIIQRVCETEGCGGVVPDSALWMRCPACSWKRWKARRNPKALEPEASPAAEHTSQDSKPRPPQPLSLGGAGQGGQGHGAHPAVVVDAQAAVDSPVTLEAAPAVQIEVTGKSSSQPPIGDTPSQHAVPPHTVPSASAMGPPSNPSPMIGSAIEPMTVDPLSGTEERPQVGGDSSKSGPEAHTVVPAADDPMGTAADEALDPSILVDDLVLAWPEAPTEDGAAGSVQETSTIPAVNDDAVAGEEHAHISGWDSELTDISSSDDSEGESEIDSASSSENQPPRKLSGIKIRIPPLASLSSGIAPAEATRICAIRTCETPLPHDYRWKLCPPCRTRNREYQRVRLNVANPRLGPSLHSSNAATSGWADSMNGDLAVPSTPTKVRMIPLPPGYRVCTLRSCTTVIPPVEEYRWKMCGPCRDRTRVSAQLRQDKATTGLDPLTQADDSDSDEVPLAANSAYYRKRKRHADTPAGHSNVAPHQAGKTRRRLIDGRHSTCANTFCGALVDPSSNRKECADCCAKGFITVSRSHKKGKGRANVKNQKPKSQPFHQYPVFQHLGKLMEALKTRLENFIEAQKCYLQFKHRQEGFEQTSAAFAFDGEYAIVADPQAKPADTQHRVNSIQKDIGTTFGINFDPNGAFSLRDGGVLLRFSCCPEFVMLLPKPTAEKPDDTIVLAKHMTGELEVAVLPDDSHPFWTGQRITVRFRLVG
ncbi:hypothetical protein PLICRDRAFT_136726 [Plicaturopsis crispa FD-325 SS-3]|nr:hypothetical protein PLICRDRAFT_136726 [Plicaturopsis crispa FD-325 SS-3]